MTALPPEIGQLTALQRLELDSNQLTALPPEAGQLTALSAAAKDDKGGLFVHKNPLLDPYPRLTAMGQPSATSNVISWMRGELDLTTLPMERAPEPPSQGPGPHFEINDEGVIVFAPPEALDRQGNNVARLKRLHPTLSDLSADLIRLLGGSRIGVLVTAQGRTISLSTKTLRSSICRCHWRSKKCCNHAFRCCNSCYASYSRDFDGLNNCDCYKRGSLFSGWGGVEEIETLPRRCWVGDKGAR